MNHVLKASARLVLASLFMWCSMLAATLLISAGAMEATTGIYLKNIPDLVLMEKLFLTLHTDHYGTIASFFVLSGAILCSIAGALYFLGRRHNGLWLVPLGLLVLSYPLVQPQIALTRGITSLYSDNSYEAAFPKRTEEQRAEALEDDELAPGDAEPTSAEVGTAFFMLASSVSGYNPRVMAIAGPVGPVIGFALAVMQWAILLAALVLVIWPVRDAIAGTRRKPAAPAA